MTLREEILNKLAKEYGYKSHKDLGKFAIFNFTSRKRIAMDTVDFALTAAEAEVNEEIISHLNDSDMFGSCPCAITKEEHCETMESLKRVRSKFQLKQNVGVKADER